jgi:hypothetical protein
MKNGDREAWAAIAALLPSEVGDVSLVARILRLHLDPEQQDRLTVCPAIPRRLVRGSVTQILREEQDSAARGRIRRPPLGGLETIELLDGAPTRRASRSC